MAGLMNLMFLFFFQLSVSYYKCFYIDTLDNSGKMCSTVFCSNNKISNMYEDSKFLLTELEDILFNLRNEKESHQIENEYNKQLDYEITFPQTDNYEDIYLLDLHKNPKNNSFVDFSDLYFDEQMESEMREPVPFINIQNLEEPEGNEEYNKNEINDTTDRLLSSEEKVDRLLSKIRELEDADTNEETTNKKSYMKRYFR